MTADAAWLDLGGRGVDPVDAERQRQSAVLITRLQALRPGFILADEVGMGKTYVTFGHMALRIAERRNMRVLVVAPSSDMARKWRKDLLDFCEKSAIKKAQLSELLEPRLALNTHDLIALRGRGVVITTLSAATGGFGRAPEKDRAWLFEAALQGSRRRSATRSRLARRFGVRARARRAAIDTELFGCSLQRASTVARRHLGPYLLEENRTDRQEFDRALRAARRELIRLRLPRSELLVLDEAHKLKNPGSARFLYLEEILRGRFQSMLFLTATPFQIDLSELEAIFRLLCHATGAGRDELAEVSARVAATARRFRERFELLEREWRHAPSAAAVDPGEIASLSQREQLVRRALEAALAEHDLLARDMPMLMLRNRRPDAHRIERVGSLRGTGERGVSVEGAGRVVFAVSVRLFHEMRHNRRPTFDPVVLQSLTSSYQAFTTSPVRRRATGDQELFYVRLIEQLAERAPHPKVREVVDATVANVVAGEKTLIFTERIQTAEHLAQQIDAQLARELRKREEQLMPDGPRRLDQFAAEMLNRRSPLSLLWRDNLLHTLFPRLVPPAELRMLTSRRELNPVIARALRASSEGVSRSTARKRDVLAAAAAVERHIAERAHLDDEAREYALALVPEEDLLDLEDTLDLSDGPDFDVDGMRALLLGTRGFWARAGFANVLSEIDDANLRAHTVRGLRGAIIGDPQARMLILYALARRRSRDRTRAVDLAFASARWCGIRERLDRFFGLMLEHQSWTLRHGWIDAVERTQVVVARLTGTADEKSRSRHGDAFNTPFRPWVAVASVVSQEGLDLQRECSRVVHHDLSWNPASLEQRVGRVDRIHSRTNRLRKQGIDAELEIGIPIIRGTIDERMWNVVEARRKWFDVCLGLEHDWDNARLDDAAPSMPPSVAERLRIDLSLEASRRL